MQEDPSTEVVHIVSCPEGPVCPAVIRVAGLVGESAVIGREPAPGEQPGPGEFTLPGRAVTDPAVARALRKHIGPGEGARIVPNALLDAVRQGATPRAAGPDESDLIVPAELLTKIRKEVA